MAQTEYLTLCFALFRQVRLSVDSLHPVGEEVQAPQSRKLSIMSKSSDGKPPLAAMGRRRSTLRDVAQSVTSMLSIRRMTRAMSIFRPPESRAKVKLENTYQLGPQNGSVFSPEKVKDVIEQVLQEYLDDTKYNARECKDLSKDVSADIKNRIKELKFDRYKIICNVVIGQCHDQGFQMASRAVWQHQTDNWASATYRNSSLFALAVVHGIYYE